MADLARSIDGIACVASAAERDGLYAVPQVHRRVFRTDLGLQQRYTGTEWVTDSIFPLVTGEVGASDLRYPVGHVFRYGATGDGVTDDTAAIQAAITAATERVIIPDGTYIVRPLTASTDETGAVMVCFQMQSDMHIWMSKNATLKIADGVSSVGSPVQMRMFHSNEVLTNITFEGGTLDMNAANNPIEGVGLPSNRYNQTHIMFSGTPGGVAASGTDVRIEGVTFLNTPGTTCICMAQSNSVGVTLGQRWTVRDCVFTNNGTITDDHSSIYGWADDVLVEGNTFNGVASTVSYSNSVALEVHGARHRFLGNNVRSYYQGLWISINYTSDVDGTIVADNQFTDLRGIGVDVDRSVASAFPVTRSTICNNLFEFNDLAITADLKVGVQVAAVYQIDGVEITNNRVVKTGTSNTCAAVSIATQSVAAQEHTNIVVSGNTSTGTTFGLYLYPSATCGLGTIICTRNRWLDMTTTAAFTQAMGIGLPNGPGTLGVDTLVIDGNVVKDAAYGSYLTSAIAQLERRDNSYINVTTRATETAACVVTRRRGNFDSTVTTLAEADLVSGVTPADVNTYLVTLTAARAVGAPLNAVAGQRITFTFIQDATGGRAVTWNAVYKLSWSDVGNTASKRSTISVVFDGTNWNQDGAQTPYV